MFLPVVDPNKDRTMNRKHLLCVGLVALAACSSATVENGVASGAREAAAAITAPDIHARIAFLASDELRGRDTPSPGLEAAAAWIAEEFERFGLEPGAGEDWLQRYPFPLEALDHRETRVEISSGATHALEYGIDFFAQPGSAPSVPAGVVYLADPSELARGPDGGIRDRVAMVRLRALPEDGRGGWRFDGQTRAVINEATARARDAGAAGLAFVMDERVSRADVAALARTAEAPTRVLGGRSAGGQPAVFFLTHNAALRLFRMAGLDGAEILRLGRADRPQPLPGITLRLAAPLATLDAAEPPNVVGILRGRDPDLRETYVVLSAHMDHVGVGRPDASGDSIYNGADDNASGTAGLMAVARAFTSLPEPPARSVIFLAVSGEEKGLLGSRWFAENPTVPIGGIIANINMDMIGRNAPDSVVVIGQEYSSLGPLVRQVAADHPDLGLTVAADPWPEQRFFFRSDHFSFAAREIPALFFFTGTHEDYHRPSDTVERIDADKAARVARLAFLVALRISQHPEPPEWDPAGLEEVRALTGR
jgi:hypothetical protein